MGASAATTEKTDDAYAPFRALLAKLVADAGSQRAFAAKTGLDQPSVGRLLKGAVSPTLANLAKIGAACGYTREELLRGRRPAGAEETSERKPYAAVQLDQIVAVHNWRETFDREALDELADSIAANGLLQPLALSLDILDPPGAALPDGRPLYGLVDGERRWRALCRLADADPAGFAARFGPDSPGGGIPHVVQAFAGTVLAERPGPDAPKDAPKDGARDGDEDGAHGGGGDGGAAEAPGFLDPLTAAKIAGLTANLARRDLADHELTRALAELQQVTGLDGKALARRVGRGVTQVQQHLRIARRLPERDPDAARRYFAGTLLFTRARDLVTDKDEGPARSARDLVTDKDPETGAAAPQSSPLHPEPVEGRSAPCDLDDLRRRVAEHPTLGLALLLLEKLRPYVLTAAEPGTVPNWTSYAAQARETDPDLDLRLRPLWDQVPPRHNAALVLTELVEFESYELVELLNAAQAERLGPLDGTGGALLDAVIELSGTPRTDAAHADRPQEDQKDA